MLGLWRKFGEILLLLVVLAVIVRVFVVTPYKISTNKLEPVFKNGDIVLVYNLSFGIKIPYIQKKIGFTAPNRGEVVFYNSSLATNNILLRRIVGLAGDKIEIVGGKLLVNGQEVAGGVTYMPKLKSPYYVPQGHVLLADNGDQLTALGEVVPMNCLEGRAFLILISLAESQEILPKVRWDRLLSLIN